MTSTLRGQGNSSLQVPAIHHDNHLVSSAVVLHYQAINSEGFAQISSECCRPNRLNRLHEILQDINSHLEANRALARTETPTESLWLGLHARACVGQHITHVLVSESELSLCEMLPSSCFHGRLGLLLCEQLYLLLLC